MLTHLKRRIQIRITSKIIYELELIRFYFGVPVEFYFYIVDDGFFILLTNLFNL